MSNFACVQNKMGDFKESLCFWHLGLYFQSLALFDSWGYCVWLVDRSRGTANYFLCVYLRMDLFIKLELGRAILWWRSESGFRKHPETSCLWWCMPIIPTLRKPRKKDLGFEANLSYMGNLNQPELYCTILSQKEKCSRGGLVTEELA